MDSSMGNMCLGKDVIEISSDRKRREAEVTGQLVNVLCQVRFTTLFAKFLILEIPIDWDTPIVVGRGFLDMIGGNIDIPNRIFTTFDGRTRQTFRAAKSEKIRITESDSDNKEDYTSGTYDHEVGSSRAKRSRNVETVEEALLPDVHHEFLEWRGCSREAKSRYNSRNPESGMQIWHVIIAKWHEKKGKARIQKDSQICCGNPERVDSDSEDRLIPQDSACLMSESCAKVSGVQRALMQDLYERMGSMEIRQEAIKRMEYRHAYHWDRDNAHIKYVREDNLEK
ncbi:hypothetical protein Tco_0292017 [Tanacetum coccineum]